MPIMTPPPGAPDDPLAQPDHSAWASNVYGDLHDLDERLGAHVHGDLEPPTLHSALSGLDADDHPQYLHVHVGNRKEFGVGQMNFTSFTSQETGYINWDLTDFTGGGWVGVIEVEMSGSWNTARAMGIQTVRAEIHWDQSDKTLTVYKTEYPTSFGSLMVVNHLLGVPEQTATGVRWPLHKITATAMESFAIVVRAYGTASALDVITPSQFSITQPVAGATSAIAMPGDTGWVPVPTRPGFVNDSVAPRVRRVGKIVYMQGGWSAESGFTVNASHDVADIPVGYRPSDQIEYGYVSGSNGTTGGRMRVFANDGKVQISTGETLGGYFMSGMSWVGE